MKFSVAPESRSAVVSALFVAVWRKRCSCIDLQFEIYRQSCATLLIQAVWIRQAENLSHSGSGSHLGIMQQAISGLLEAC